jgi:putative addiction module antidote
MIKLEVRSVGNATGVVFPEETLAKLGVTKGDPLFAVEKQNGIELTANNPESEVQMDLARSIMRQDRDILQKLAET